MSEQAGPHRWLGASPSFRFFGGKGGVGKTTCAAAVAVAAARSGTTVLAASTDPAHSLGDALGIELGAEPLTLPEVAGLSAVEIDAEAAWERWLAPRRELFAALAERGSYLRSADIAPLLELRVPGVDELLGLLEVVRLGVGGDAELVVVDTAPTGHTLRLLDMPRSLERLAAVLDALEERHRSLAAAFGGGYRPGDADAAIAEIRDQARHLEELLVDRERTTFSWVLLAEPMAIAESRRALDALAERGIEVAELVVNRLAREDDGCAAAIGRLVAERAALGEVRRRFPRRRVRVVREAADEPRGPAALAALTSTAAAAYEGVGPVEPSAAFAGGVAAGEGVDEVAASGVATRTLLPPAVELVVVGGKGGVGKTTCAAALALGLARERPERRVDLVSTDPAHSLADVLALDGPCSSPTPVRAAGIEVGVEEIDAAARFAAHRESLVERLERFVAVGDDRRGGELPIDRQVIESLVEAVPPGLDELMAIDDLAARLGAADAPLVVLDTAPTGHAIRLLELPELALTWVRSLMRILLDYREALGLGDLAAELLEMSKALDRVRRLLSNHERCAFVAVTRPEELPCRETVRLCAALERLGVAVAGLVVNGVIRSPAADCQPVLCHQRDWIERHRQLLAGRTSTILLAPLSYPQPIGVERLGAWLAEWWGDEPSTTRGGVAGEPRN